MNDENDRSEEGAVDMHLGFARMFARLMAQLVRNGALTEPNVAEILVGEERIIAALCNDGDLRSALALSALHDAIETELEGRIELQPHVDQLHRQHKRSRDLKTPRELLNLTPDEWRDLLRKQRLDEPEP